MHNFIFDYSRILAGAIGADFRDNYDSDRFGSEKKRPFCMKECLRELLARLGLTSAGAARQTMCSGLRFVEPHLADLEWLYGKLADDESRQILASVIAFRALGHRKIRLSRNSPTYWASLRKAENIAQGREELDAGFLGWKLYKCDLRSLGYPIKLFTFPRGCVEMFALEQYRCITPAVAIGCEQGDMVVDAGACYGDTALYFAHLAGPSGKVAAFEFLPANLDILRQNLALNPELAERVCVVENAVWSKTGETLHFNALGPGTSVVGRPNDVEVHKVQTLTIDDLVRRGDLPRVDFVKMDIEGAEMAALAGAGRVIRDFKPKLAITVYHNIEDFWSVPRFLDELHLGYRFYLRHFSIHAEETVLFAKAL